MSSQYELVCADESLYGLAEDDRFLSAGDALAVLEDGGLRVAAAHPRRGRPPRSCFYLLASSAPFSSKVSGHYQQRKNLDRYWDLSYDRRCQEFNRWPLPHAKLAAWAAGDVFLDDGVAYGRHRARVQFHRAEDNGRVCYAGGAWRTRVNAPPLPPLEPEEMWRLKVICVHRSENAGIRRKITFAMSNNVGSASNGARILVEYVVSPPTGGGASMEVQTSNEQSESLPSAERVIEKPRGEVPSAALSTLDLTKLKGDEERMNRGGIMIENFPPAEKKQKKAVVLVQPLTQDEIDGTVGQNVTRNTKNQKSLKSSAKKSPAKKVQSNLEKENVVPEKDVPMVITDSMVELRDSLKTTTVKLSSKKRKREETQSLKVQKQVEGPQEGIIIEEQNDNEHDGSFQPESCSTMCQPNSSKKKSTRSSNNKIKKAFGSVFIKAEPSPDASEGYHQDQFIFSSDEISAAGKEERVHKGDIYRLSEDGIFNQTTAEESKRFMPSWQAYKLISDDSLPALSSLPSQPPEESLFFLFESSNELLEKLGQAYDARLSEIASSAEKKWGRLLYNKLIRRQDLTVGFRDGRVYAKSRIFPVLMHRISGLRLGFVTGKWTRYSTCKDLGFKIDSPGDEVVGFNAVISHTVGQAVAMRRKITFPISSDLCHKGRVLIEYLRVEKEPIKKKKVPKEIKKMPEDNITMACNDLALDALRLQCHRSNRFGVPKISVTTASLNNNLNLSLLTYRNSMVFEKGNFGEDGKRRATLPVLAALHSNGDFATYLALLTQIKNKIGEWRPMGYNDYCVCINRKEDEDNADNLTKAMRIAFQDKAQVNLRLPNASYGITANDLARLLMETASEEERSTTCEGFLSDWHNQAMFSLCKTDSSRLEARISEDLEDYFCDSVEIWSTFDESENHRQFCEYLFRALNQPPVEYLNAVRKN